MTGADVGTPDRDALTTAVMALHTAVDGWAAGVVAAADAHPGDAGRAVELPALGEAEEAFDQAFDGFHEAASRVLGIDDGDVDDLEDGSVDPADAVGVELYATVTGAGVGEPVVIVDGASEQVVAALEAAGYQVTGWGVSLVPVRTFGGPDEPADDEGPA